MNKYFLYDNIWWYVGPMDPYRIDKLLGYTPKTILEFGSFDGGDGLKYKLTHPQAEVYSFEPNPYCYPEVQRIQKYGVHTYKLAVYSHSGALQFYTAINKNTGKEWAVGSTLKIKEESKKTVPQIDYAKDPIYVQAITVHNFCRLMKIEQVDFMHIDVEGAAEHVIKGFDKILPNLIFIEVPEFIPTHEGAATRKNVKEMLFDLHYELIEEDDIDCLFKRRVI